MLRLRAEGDGVEVGLNLCGEREGYFEKQRHGAQSLLSGLRQHQSAGLFLQAQPDGSVPGGQRPAGYVK